MTRLLEEAFNTVAALPDARQDEYRVTSTEVSIMRFRHAARRPLDL
jgi:hypothetical protein